MAGKSRFAHIPEDFRERAISGRIRDVIAHFQIGHSTFYRWAEAVGILDEIRTRQTIQPRREMPADFADHAHEGNADLKKRYPEIGKDAFARFRKELGIAAGRTSTAERPPAGFRRAVAEMYVAQACRHYERDESVIRRWARETGAIFKVWRGYVNTKPAPLTDHRPATVASSAQLFLQRIGPVYRQGGDFSVFGRRMSETEMISKAEAKGFRADAWRSL